MAIGNKNWKTSRTLWVNVLALMALIAQSKYGFVISLEEEASALIVVNMILRIFTDRGLSR